MRSFRQIAYTPTDAHRRGMVFVRWYRKAGRENVAGPARNREMVESGAGLCIALHRRIEASKGTKDCVRQALAAGIPIYLIEDDRAIPRRLQAGDKRLS